MIKGIYKTRKVYINEKELSLKESLEYHQASPTGFNWGYGGAGPEQLAFALLYALTTLDLALGLFMAFKKDVISQLPKKDFTLKEQDIITYAKQHAPQYFASLEIN